MIGRLRHWGFAFDATIRHEVQDACEGVAGTLAVLFRVEGVAVAVRAAVGEDVDAWLLELRPG